MRQNWGMLSGALPKSECESIIHDMKKTDAIDGSVFNSSKEYRKSKIRWVSGQASLEQFLLREINLINAEFFNVDIQQAMAEIQFSEYDSEYGGKYDWHHDIDWHNPNNFDRKLSVVVQLSDPDTYKGGDFEFSESQSPNKDELRMQGSILVFPSYLVHRVTEITEGVRYSLVSWIKGPRWR